MLQKKNSNETSKTNPALDLTLSPALSLPQTLIHHFLNNTLKQIVAKALDGQRYPLPLCECMVVWGG